MKNSSFIAISVFALNMYYTKKQNKSKEKFFEYLDKGISPEEFEQELIKVWGKDNSKYIKEEITKFREQVHQENTNSKLDLSKVTLAGLGVTSLINETNKSFLEKKVKEYTLRFNSPLLKSDKQEYLKKLVPKYTNDTKGYYSQGRLVRNVKPSTYNSMVYNTTLTRNGWIQTLNDGEEDQLFYIPAHNFCCPICASYQGRIFTREEAIETLGEADEVEGDILHPNCKCVLTFYQNQPTPRLNMTQVEEEYNIRQKVNGLTLRKEEVLTDIRIQKGLGNQDQVDKLNQQRNKINSQIRELKNQLDSEEKQKQVTAIYRYR
jgi:hypothetical protein